MSSRRKRAPPSKVDEEKKKKLCWNMHEDRRNEMVALEDEVTNEDHIPVPSTSASFIVINDDSTDEDLVQKENLSKSVKFLTVNDEDDSYSILTPVSVQLNIIVLPYRADRSWKALLGEFALRLPSEQILTDEFRDRSFTLMRGDSDDELQVCVHERSEEEYSNETKEYLGAYEQRILVEATLSGEILEGLRWLQKKKIIGLYQRPGEAQALKVGIYLLEAGLSKPEFLSDGGGRPKKANQMIQKLMEKFYSFLIPDELEDDEEESDMELERQNIEELYDFVRHTHQQDIQSLRKDVQHPALIPILRPYQSEAVNWMLHRENHTSTPSSENALHFLWREVITLDGIKIYYNPFTGCIIREYPTAGPQWPGGILADEMGLGKTVEVLALILNHTGPDIKQDDLTLPEGKLVNFFVPPQPLEGNKKKKTKEMEPKLKEKIQYPSLRVMILAAVKEMNVKKGASIIAIFKYISSVYRYDTQRNRRLLKRTLEKLIAEQVVEQVKGHGLAGSFKLGKNYKEQKKRERTKEQVARTSENSQKKQLIDAKTQTKESRNSDETSENVFKTASHENITMEEHDYCTTSKNKRKSEADHENSVEEKNVKQETVVPKSPDFHGNLLVSSDMSSHPDVDVSKTTAVIQQEIPKVQSSHSQERAGSSVQHTSSVFPFNTSEYRFECICGELGLADYKARVQCLKCHLWQHAECVNYKEENLKSRPFYCPHCLVAMKPVPTRATLIISPSSICHQWVDEINRHVRSSSLRVLVRPYGFIFWRVILSRLGACITRSSEVFVLSARALHFLLLDQCFGIMYISVPERQSAISSFFFFSCFSWSLGDKLVD